MLCLLLHDFHFATDFPYLEVLMITREHMARVSFQQHSWWKLDTRLVFTGPGWINNGYVSIAPACSCSFLFGYLKIYSLSQTSHHTCKSFNIHKSNYKYKLLVRNLLNGFQVKFFGYTYIFNGLKVEYTTFTKMFLK